MNVIHIISTVIFWIYGISFIPAILFTYYQEVNNMKIEDAPNRFLGLVFHFLTVWFITPFFFFHMISKRR